MFDNVAVGIFILIVIAALGCAIGFLLGKAKGQELARSVKNADLEELTAQRDDLRQQLADLAAAHAESRAQSDGLGQQLAFVKSQLAQSQQAEQLRLQRERERAEAEAERRRHEDAKTMAEQSKVLEALAPVQKNLDALQHKVTQIEEGRKQEMGALGEQLKGLGEQQSRLDKETSSLSAALRNNTIRGAWGEAQLKNIVESAGLLEHVDFDTQVVVEDDNGRTQRPDMVVHLPGGKSIPIDAKAPYADYQRACAIPDTASEEELARRSQLLKSHAKALRDHVKVLGDKAYWNAFDTAPDFVVAFIPNEALLQAAMETDPALMDDAFSKKVALTSPVTLWAVLKSVAYAWQQQSLTDDAKQLFDLSRELYERFAVLGDKAQKLGSAITRTVASYNAFASSLESRVLVTARKLQKIDQNKVIEPLEIIDSDKADVKELTAPEVQSAGETN
ncbi:DNA recombination protein RmuC [Bifidobacterium tsurumiense]|uniref:Putative DNA recombination protein RmuC n=1 Tax=Bifidobacterium tsurumiense TaxID=356829 RepID=A0A087EI02_9BIFI|nr:DNA recombination protein RmuC [Bifidobacterium tsurumiense]KFJ07403.1 putative DNA recombination protein RmuC [Bifidobacterium tsurumiense]MDY4677398.1 DNA recombination protein RmuC [Bifidobacterium tsurumiense]MSS13163.1 DNA recombination protein RmuC [Bifidobacterium tsurumiense]